jgi:UDP-N-acetylglucosamine/UDP-N-acetylgalactosamine diphosphorylase
MAPNGHGGFLISSGVRDVLLHLQAEGIRHIVYNQVDNLLCRYEDPLFVGYSIQAATAVCLKLFCKRVPEERLGTLLRHKGVNCILEYSEIPPEIAGERFTNGELRYRWGNPSMYCFSLPSILNSWSEFSSLPVHYVEKIVPCGGNPVPALKAERYIHDAFGRILSFSGLVVDPEDEFAPIKGATGNESVEDAPVRLSRAYRRWLAQAEITVGDEWRIEMDPGEFAVAEDVCDRKDQILSRAKLYPDRKVMYLS